MNEHLIRQQYITQQQDHLENVIANLKTSIDDNQRALRELGRLYLQSVSDYEGEQSWTKYDPEGTLKPLVEFVATRLEKAPSICKGERRWRTRTNMTELAKGRFSQRWTEQFEKDGNLAALHLQALYVMTNVMDGDHTKGSMEFRAQLYRTRDQVAHDSGRYYVARAEAVDAEGESA